MLIGGEGLGADNSDHIAIGGDLGEIHGEILIGQGGGGEGCTPGEAMQSCGGIGE
jgi:hypothetical protein